MKAFEVTLTVTAVVAAGSEEAAENLAKKLAPEIIRDQGVEVDSCRQLKSLDELAHVDDGQWIPEAMAYGMPPGDSRTLGDLLPKAGHSRCPDTVDMFEEVKS